MKKCRALRTQSCRRKMRIFRVKALRVQEPLKKVSFISIHDKKSVVIESYANGIILVLSLVFLLISD